MVNCIVVLLLYLFCSVAAFAGDESADDEGSTLRVLRTFFVPVKEISAMVRGGENEILVVGDDAPMLGIVTITDEELELTQTLNFTRTLWQKFYLCPGAQNDTCSELSRTITSEWEGIYYYPQSKEIALMQESTGSVLTFNRSMKQIDAHTVLDFMLKTGKGSNSSNSLGEGFLPLASGRMLVAREKFPAAVVEFGALGESPNGYQAKETKLASSSVDVANDDGKMRNVLYPLHNWYLRVASRDPDTDCDLSDITVANNGKLYGISQVCRQIYRFDDLSPRDDELQVVEKWNLPEQMNTAESLIVIKNGVFLVAVDTKEDINSIFLMAESGKKNVQISD